MGKERVEKRKPNGAVDYFALAVTTFGVGYLPIAPGTWGSLVGAGFYFFLANSFHSFRYSSQLAAPEYFVATIHAAILIGLLLFCLLGIWASSHAIELLGHTDPSQAVVDEVMGQLIVFLFIPFTTSWVIILAGFLLFRLFDIWKPYPIDHLQDLPGGIGICADDILAGVYAGVCLSIIYAVTLYV